MTHKEARIMRDRLKKLLPAEYVSVVDTDDAYSDGPRIYNVSVGPRLIIGDACADTVNELLQLLEVDRGAE